MKFTDEFKGVKDGDIYPVTFKAGDECPKELEAAAREAGALADHDEAKKAKPKK